MIFYPKLSSYDNLFLACNLSSFLCFLQLLRQTTNLLDNQYSNSQLLRKEAAIIIIYLSDTLFIFVHLTKIINCFTCTPSTTSTCPQLHVPRG